MTLIYTDDVCRRLDDDFCRRLDDVDVCRRLDDVDVCRRLDMFCREREDCLRTELILELADM